MKTTSIRLFLIVVFFCALLFIMLKTTPWMNAPDQVPTSLAHHVSLDSVAIFSEDNQLIKVVYYPESRNNNFEKYANYIHGYPKSDKLIGDFNGDHQQDTAWFDSNYLDYMQSNIEWEDIRGYLHFSDPTISSLNLGLCGFGSFKNEGDLDDNGIDEIGVMCYSPIGSCREYFVYTFKNGEWYQFLPGIESSSTMRMAGIVLIEKDESAKGYVFVRNMLYFINDSMSEPYKNQGGGYCARSHVREYRVKVSSRFSGGFSSFSLY